MCHSSAATSSWRWRWRSSSACWSSSRTASSAALRSEMYKQLQHGVRNAPPRYWLVLVLILFFIGLPTVISSFQASEWTLVLIFAIVIMGLNILVGYSGQISLGHGALMAAGASRPGVCGRFIRHHHRRLQDHGIRNLRLLRGDRWCAIRARYRFRKPRHVPPCAVVPAPGRNRRRRPGLDRGPTHRRRLHLLAANRLEPVRRLAAVDPGSDRLRLPEGGAGGDLRGAADRDHDLRAEWDRRARPRRVHAASGEAARGRGSGNWTDAARPADCLNTSTEK